MSAKKIRARAFKPHQRKYIKPLDKYELIWLESDAGLPFDKIFSGVSDGKRGPQILFAPPKKDWGDKECGLQMTNVVSRCRQEAEEREEATGEPHGCSHLFFTGDRRDLRYGLKGCLIVAVPNSDHCSKRVSKGGVGNGTPTPRRRGTFSSGKPVDERKIRIQ